jgi:bifunctional non-homologous end joining protein LigD
LSRRLGVALEGVVSKRRDAPYRSGRSDTWVKTKCRPGIEVVIGGWRTEGGRFHSLIASVRDRGLTASGKLRQASFNGLPADKTSELRAESLVPRSGS